MELDGIGFIVGYVVVCEIIGYLVSSIIVWICVILVIDVKVTVVLIDDGV